jgi:hypothetical protein
MGKLRKQRLSQHNKVALTSHVVEKKKITLTENQLKNLITRVRINQMSQCGMTRPQIQKELKCGEKTIRRWLGVGFNDPLDYIEEGRTGRPEVPIEIEDTVLAERKMKTFTPRKMAKQLGVSHMTVVRILEDADAKWTVKPKTSRITEAHKKARLKFCEEYQNKDLEWWDKILVTDSKIFLLDGGHNPRYHGQWLLAGEEIELWQVDKYSSGLHVYGGMTSRGLTKLIFINGSVTGERYVNEILPSLTNVETRKKVTKNVTTTKLFDQNDDWIFEHDHARAHDSNIAQEWLFENVPCFFCKDETPAKLDDLWCIERIWAVMTYKVYGDGQGQPATLDELMERIITAWKSLNVKMLRKCVHQMPLRMKQIIKNKGGRIVYFKQHCECDDCKE